MKINPSIIKHNGFSAVMIIKLMAASVFILAQNATAQVKYSKRDTLTAKKYFNKSWDYPVFSQDHQKYLDSALIFLPTNAYYWQQKSMPYYKKQKYELARPFLDSAVKYDPNSWLEYRAFIKCIYEKNYSGALADFKAAKERYGNRIVMDHWYTFYMGLCYLQLNQFDSSRNYLGKCIQHEINRSGEKSVHFLHYFYFGLVYFEMGNDAEAIKYLDKALARYPNFSDAAYYKAFILASASKWQEAMDTALLALEHNINGYTINEDNAVYETYPYQTKAEYINSLIRFLEEKIKSK